ncbi:2-hydroxyacyl-CoA lyase [Vitis vinifera]|uniref:2-hydroxyacyl-CoA lyase n=1 Tax=Vitis vinifera TaxID=29760 RepID=A0A438K114_VITVI|nr:2-hydroxyacyl-CoA lyase [Vitis vinifera]
MADSDRKIHDSQTLVDGNLLAAKAFAAAGVTLMFGVVGILVTSFAKRAVSILICFLAFHNEQWAGYAASAYGYLTGKADLLLIVSGHGCVQGLAGLSNATANAWSVVMISGSCNQADFGRGDFQKLDKVAAVEPFSKFSAKATDISQIPKSLFKVLDQALSGRRLVLDLSNDILHQTVSLSEAEGL